MGTSPRQLLLEYGLEPHKGLGQNFLLDRGALSRIVAAADVQPGDRVLEIGPGLGILTRALAEAGASVVAVELDRGLVELLHEQLAGLEQARIVHQDILKADIGQLMGDAPYKVVANLPYNITSAALRHALEAKPRPSLLVVMVQKEVAQRIVAAPGEMSLLAISVQFYGRPRIVAHVPAGAFYPRPKVDSAILRIETFPALDIPEDAIPRFFALARAGFAQRRKQLRNTLSKGLGLSTDVVEEGLRRCDIDPRRRAETLSLIEWKRLLQALPDSSA